MSEKTDLLSSYDLTKTLVKRDSRLINGDARNWLVRRFRERLEEINLIKLIGWIHPEEVKKELVNIFNVRKAALVGGNDWRADPKLQWATLALMRYNDRDAFAFWRAEIERSAHAVRGLPNRYDSPRTKFEDDVGDDLSYVRNKMIVQVAAPAIWSSKSEYPGRVFDGVVNKITDYMQRDSENCRIGENSTEEEYSKFIQYLLDDDVKFRE